jgi:hypothetical protein
MLSLMNKTLEGLGILGVVMGSVCFPSMNNWVSQSSPSPILVGQFHADLGGINHYCAALSYKESINQRSDKVEGGCINESLCGVLVAEFK